MVIDKKFKIAFSLLLFSLNNSSNNKFDKTQLKQLKQLVDHSDGTLKSELLSIYNEIDKDPTLLYDSNIFLKLNTLYNKFFENSPMTLPSNNGISILESSPAGQANHIENSTHTKQNIAKVFFNPVIDSLQPMDEHTKGIIIDTSQKDNSFEFTRTDGSSVKIVPVSSANSLYLSDLKKYKVIQEFPNLGKFSVINFIYTVIDPILLHTSKAYTDELKKSLSAQNIYDAATKHFGFLSSDNPMFNSSSPEILENVEGDLIRECLETRTPFYQNNSVLKRLIPITIFSTPSGIVTQLEYLLTGLKQSKTKLKYLFANIDYNKLCEDNSYRSTILDKIDELEQLLQDSSTNSTYFRICYNNLTGQYFYSSDPVQYHIIKSYINHVTSLQTSVDNTSPKHNSSDGR